MSVLPILIYWLLAIWGLFSPRPVLLYLMVLSLPFGSFSVVPTEVAAGLTLLPATMTGMLICLRQFLLHRSGLPFLAGSVLSARRGQLLFLFWLVAVLVTLFAPRIFSGQITIVPMRGADIGVLHPSPQNISQLAYLTISVFLTFALCHALRRPGALESLARAWIWAAGVTVLTGFLDLISQYLPIAPLLAPFRTATYALLTDDVLDGAKRIVGLTPEASVYGSLCLGFLTFLWFMRHAIPEGRWRRAALALCPMLLLFAILSTSSAAYLGIAVLAGLAGADWLWRAGHLGRLGHARRGVGPELLAVVAAIAALAGVLIAAPRLLDPVIARIDLLIFDKVDSSSFEERNFWTRISLEAGLASHLLGVGVGSTRASNAAVSVFASTGLLGALLYYGFVLQSLLRPIGAGVSSFARGMAQAARWSIGPTFVMGLLIGTSPDFGVTGAIRWAIILAVCAASCATAPPDPGRDRRPAYPVPPRAGRHLQHR